jgi:hypothetical protein
MISPMMEKLLNIEQSFKSKQKTIRESGPALALEKPSRSRT